MEQNGCRCFSTFNLRIYEFQGLLIFQFFEQFHNDNGNDFIKEYFDGSDFLREFKFPIYNKEQRQCRGYKGEFLNDIKQLSSLQFIQIYQQLLKIIMLCHNQRILAACLTEENIHFNPENNKILLLEFGFHPRLPEFINDYYLNMDLDLIRQIMSKLGKKLKKIDQNCSQILANLNTSSCTFYDLFNLSIINQQLKEEGKQFYTQQYELCVPGINQNILRYKQVDLWTLEDIRQLSSNQTTTGSYYHQIDNLIQFFFNTYVYVNQEFPQKNGFKIFLLQLIYLLLDNLLKEVQNGEPTYYSFNQQNWQEYLNQNFDNQRTYYELITSSIMEKQKQVSDLQANLKPKKYSTFDIKQEQKVSDFPRLCKDIIIEELQEMKGTQKLSLKIEVTLLLCLAFYLKGYQQIKKILGKASVSSINADEIAKNQFVLEIIEYLRKIMKIEQ